MLLTMVLEVPLAGEVFSPQLCTSIVIVSTSTYLYNLHPPPRPMQTGPAAGRYARPGLLLKDMDPHDPSSTDATRHTDAAQIEPPDEPPDELSAPPPPERSAAEDSNSSAGHQLVGTPRAVPLLGTAVESSSRAT